MLVKIMTSRNKQSPMEQKPRSALAVDLAPISQGQDGNDDLFVLMSQITRQSPTRYFQNSPRSLPGRASASNAWTHRYLQLLKMA
jgi:hypothetical protein